MVKITKIETDSLVMGKIFLCAFRYCLGRETCAPSMFIEYFTAPNFWNAITKEIKYQIYDEIMHYDKLYNPDKKYMAEWYELADKILKETGKLY